MSPGALVTAAVCIAASVATLAPVSAREVVDQQFGTAGVSLSAYGTSVRDSEVLADGSVLIVGTVNTTDGVYWRIEKLTSAGDPDVTFGDKGASMQKAPRVEAYVAGLVLTGGRILVIGSDGARGVLVVALDEQGRPDRTYGADGRAVVSIGGSSLVSVANAATTASGQIVVLGNLADPVTRLRTNSFVMRFTPTGRRDTTFGRTGVALVDVTRASVSQNLTQMTIDPRGRIVLAGSRIASVGQEMVVARLTAAGRQDRQFSADGVLTVQPKHGAVSAFSSVIAASDASLVLGGSTRPDTAASPVTSPVVVKVTAAGTLDRRFSGDGVAVVNSPTTATHVPTDLLVLANGTMVMSTSPIGMTPRPAYLVGVDHRGLLDASFGSRGVMALSFAPAHRSWATRLVSGVAADELIVFGGTAQGAGPARSVVARVLVDA
jgi:uncharacterized delta-60 repeat protein